MFGFYIAIGRQGSGKTIFITKLATDEFENTQRKIYSNYTLFKLPFTKITLDSLLDMLDQNVDSLNNSIILLDEIHLYLDSLDFMRNNNRRLQTFFSQLRKRKILLLATTQYFMNVDIRIRRQCLNVFEMEHIYKDLFKVITHEVDGYFTKEISNYNLILKDYYDCYDTLEVITE
jgi:GTPase SAR1 family protein